MDFPPKIGEHFTPTIKLKNITYLSYHLRYE